MYWQWSRTQSCPSIYRNNVCIISIHTWLLQILKDQSFLTYTRATNASDRIYQGPPHINLYIGRSDSYSKIWPLAPLIWIPRILYLMTFLSPTDIFSCVKQNITNSFYVIVIVSLRFKLYYLKNFTCQGRILVRQPLIFFCVAKSKNDNKREYHNFFLNFKFDHEFPCSKNYKAILIVKGSIVPHFSMCIKRKEGWWTSSIP
jgi:hypothetical protein